MTHMGEPCDICGDVGFEEDIATCFKCKIAREHGYCMQKVLLTIPEIWFCEECQSSIGIASPKSVTAEHVPMSLTSNASGTESISWFVKNSRGACNLASTSKAFETVNPSRFLKNQGIAGYGGMKMAVETGKVKFISTEEAIKIPSVTHKLKNSLRNADSIPGQSATIATMPKSGPTGFKDAHSVKKVKADHDLRDIGHSRSHGYYNAGFSSCTQQNSFQMSGQFQGKKTSPCKNEQQNALIPVERIGNSNLPVENGAESTDSQSVDVLPIVCSVKPVSMAILESNLLNIGPNLVKSFPNYPTPDPTWCFEILNSVSHSEFFDGFRAHPPGKVHHKALEFSKQMPGVLLCTLLPGSDVWMDVFHDECPNMEDVALYFFPGNFERSKQQYIHLLGRMEAQDLVLRSCIDGVELLIFSSTRLHAELCDSKQNFLWGVCRRSRSMTFPLLPFNDMKSLECTQNFDVKINVEKYLPKVKTEQFDGLDDSPMFSKKAAGGGAALQ
ncbi:uncharacterized protein LOC111291424 isoform X2 [Durio zibethinus]|uniref:Uncharacterized protein LOC111291424 isoform X2 n=1 Tax=Durio zibethinus TaxID=66656 RepID=A0A6P5YEN1_DURZI|nr:uncharacterized protein LOC111291424 isoform X2 [Durio zibethinus]